MTFFVLLKKYRFELTLAFACVVVANLCSLLFPWSVKILLDDVLEGNNPSLLPQVLWSLAASILLKAVFEYAGTCLGMRVGERAVADLREKLYRHLLKLSVTDVENFSTGELISRLLGDVESVKRFLLSGFLDFLYSALTALFVLVVLFVMDAKLAFFSAAVFPLFLAVYGKMGNKLKVGHGRLRQCHADLSGHLGETSRGIRTVHAFTRSEHEIHRFLAKQKEGLSAASDNHSGDAWFFVTAEFLSSAGLIALLGFGVARIGHGEMSVGTLMAFYSYLGFLFFPLLKITVVGAVYREACVSMDRVQNFLAQRPSPEEAKHPLLVQPIRGHVRFEEVNYAYPGRREVLSGLDFEVAAGEWVVVVGPNGSGKTTLACLLARLFDPLSGRVLMDGRDIRTFSLMDYRRGITVVHQNDFLFSDTIAGNIRYGNLAASDEAVIAAAVAAGLHDFIDRLSGKYDTFVGEGGIRLSGGQRQRVSLARAILRDPAVLVLDEALSAVDHESQDGIMKSLYELRRNKTTLVITHRFVPHGGRVIRLHHGKIAHAV